MTRLLHLTGGQPYSLDSLNAIRSTCEQISLAQYRAQTEAATAHIYGAQLWQNTVMLWLVVTLTLAGVTLAALQLWATYKLALAGQGALADGGEATVEHGRIVVRSSVVGVIILAMSFAFFSMYVLYVYRISEAAPPNPTPQQASEIIEQAGEGNASAPAPEPSPNMTE